MTAMTSITVTPAIPDDAPGIARVHVDGWRETYQGIVPADYLARLSYETRTALWRKELANADTCVYVARTPERIVGFASGGPNRSPEYPYDGELYAIYLEVASHGQGTGRQLVAAVADDLARRGFHAMLVWVLAENPARHFYEKLGAREIGQQTLELGGATLVEIAYVWGDLTPLVNMANTNG